MLKNLAVAATMLFTLSANATIYQVQDHPDGTLTDDFGPYGLRLDGLAPPDGVGPTFSTELNGVSASLDWDGVTASMFGTLWHNTLGEIWEFEQTFTGVVAAVGGGFTATGGVLSIWDAADMIPMHVVELKQDGEGIAFYALNDDHRCEGYEGCGPAVGRGWVDGENGTNDWLVQFDSELDIEQVPEPAPVALMGIGLLALRRFAKKRI